MSIYKNVKIKQNKKMHDKSQVVSKKSLHLLSTFFILFITLGLFGFSLRHLSLSNEIRNITSSWAPNIQGLGKLKFVINQDELEEDVFSSLELMAMPFENSNSKEMEQGVFLINGLGSLLVKSCMGGKVIKVDGEAKKTVHVSHGKGLVSVYSGIDMLGVKVNDKVEKNTPLGVSESSEISFKVLYKNKPMAGLTVKDGELTFD